MSTISLAISGETPVGVAVTALSRVDTGGAVPGVDLPADMELVGGAWTLTFADAAPSLVYSYVYRVSWADGTWYEGAGTVGRPAGSVTGSGDNPINHSGGMGVTVDGATAAADCMRFTRGGAGVDNVEVVAYLKSDYDAGSQVRRGTTFTGADGRWKAPLMLDAGTYTILASKGGFLVDSRTVVVP